MPRYLEVAADANGTAKELFKLFADNLPGVNDMERLGYSLTEEGDGQRFDAMLDREKCKAAELIARLVNYGLRCSPRAVQSTVRLRAVQRAVKGLPVSVSMEVVQDEKTDRTYNRLVVTPTKGY